MAVVFEQRLQGYMPYVRQHEDPIIQTLALSLLPRERLENEATKIENWQDDSSLRIVIPLLHWYKNEFFRWMDQPDCSNCASPTTEPYQPTNAAEADLLSRPTSLEAAGGASRIELYRCSVCNRLERFARYNSPAILLETRKGRCGEWANCFYLFLRAIGLTARFVVDWTDHVWCEVFSKSNRKWIHVDPCEEAYDKPLLYEAGWSKKLSYVFGFNNFEAVDVTWRYVRDRKAVATRRTEVPEKSLVQILRKLNMIAKDGLTADEKKEYARLHIWELVDMLQPRKVKKGESVGRESGSAQWRLARGETKSSSAPSDAGYCFKPNEDEAKERRVAISYNCAVDRYSRGNTVVGGWQTLAWKSVNLFRKIERDWKMAYLCRNERNNGTEKGLISWRIDLRGSSPSLTIGGIEMTIKSDTFAVGASVRLIVCSSESEGFSTPALLDTALSKSPNYFKLTCGEHFHDAIHCLTITLELTGSSGQLAWQHAQLFRQSLITDREERAFDLKIDLAPGQ